jgi:hypothetical protein
MVPAHPRELGADVVGVRVVQVIEDAQGPAARHPQPLRVAGCMADVAEVAWASRPAIADGVQ